MSLDIDCKWSHEFSDDITASNNGLSLPRYDAFLLYDNADIQSASAVVEKLEIDYKLKVIFFLIKANHIFIHFKIDFSFTGH